MVSTWEEGERGTKENRVAADEVEGVSELQRKRWRAEEIRD